MTSAKPTWLDCLEAGMTAQQAADVRGVTAASAHAWANKHKVRFRPAPLSEAGAQMRSLRAAVSPLDRALNAAFAEVFGDRWEGPQ